MLLRCWFPRYHPPSYQITIALVYHSTAMVDTWAELNNNIVNNNVHIIYYAPCCNKLLPTRENYMPCDLIHILNNMLTFTIKSEYFLCNNRRHVLKYYFFSHNVSNDRFRLYWFQEEKLTYDDFQ